MKQYITALSRFLIIALALANFAYSHAQTITGSVRGLVSDSSGAAIPGIQVVATNVDTGISTSTITNGTGLYSLRFLPIGHYTLAAKSQAFADYKSSIFQIGIDQDATVNILMTLRSSTQNVQVVANISPILDQENATLGTTITEKALSSLPLDGLSFLATTVAVPGSIHSGGTTYEEPGINGNRQEDNSILLDGMDIYDNINNTGISDQGILYKPNPDALQEVRVITSNASAEFGNANGGIIVAVTKSGTNQFHGNAFANLENYRLNANSWANKDTSGPAAAITPFTQTYFGGTLGGPIKKDRLFFFVDYMGYRLNTRGTALTTVAPAPFRTGDLSQLPVHLFDSQNNDAPFVNNQVPIKNPVAAYIFSHPEVYPLANNAPQNEYVRNNFIGPSVGWNEVNQGDTKIDWKVSPQDTVSGRFTISRTYGAVSAAPIPIVFPDAPAPDAYTSFTAAEDHIFSNNAINELRVGFGRSYTDYGLPTDPTGDFGTSGNKIVGIALPQNGCNGFTDQAYAGSLIGYVGDTCQQDLFIQNTFYYGDEFTYEHGLHLIKMGVQLLRYQQNYAASGDLLGVITYTGAFSGDPFADYLLNYVDQETTQGIVGRFAQRQWRDSYFIQDDWKARPNLTINLGLRYDYFQPLYEKNNKQANVNEETGVISYAGVNGASRALYNPTYDGFSPRIGFAYSVTPKFVIRGGYGISSYWEGQGVSLRLTFNPPFQVLYQGTASTPSVSNPAGSPLNVGTPLSSDVAVTGSYLAWSPDDRPSVSQQFNLTTEYQLSKNSSIRIGYVGQLVQHLVIPRVASQWPAACANAATCPTSQFANTLGSTAVLDASDTIGTMNYNSLQTTYSKHEHGLDFIANYTYSKSMTNAGQGFNGEFGTSGIYYQQDAFNLNAEYGPSPLDAANNVSGSIVYELPFGWGGRYGANWHRTTDLALGGWTLGVIANAFTGNPVTLTSQMNYNVRGEAARANYLRPLHVVNRSVAHWFGTDPSAVPCTHSNQGFNSDGVIKDNGACAYSEESKIAFGSAANGSERGPGFQNVDLSGFKVLHITQGQDLAFRVDAFNAFNFAAYNIPDTGVNDSSFGEITSTRSGPRTLQLGLNYRF